ncbi:hypothetical protein A1D31_39325 [Bradyrhizobium liaoningense]|nr:hypothetical protein A1D31_39325 [Bradyrhizobium liaoningense]
MLAQGRRTDIEPDNFVPNGNEVRNVTLEEAGIDRKLSSKAHVEKAATPAVSAHRIADEVRLLRAQVECGMVRVTSEGDFTMNQTTKVSDSPWSKPLVLAIFTAALAAFGNILLASINNSAQRELERVKGEAVLILEMIKTTPEKARINLQFLVDAGLISEERQVAKLKAYGTVQNLSHF